MATKKGRKSVSKKRRKVSGVKLQNKQLMTALGVTGGLILTAIANQKISEMKDASGQPKVDPMIVSIGEIVVGLFAPQFIGKGNDLVNGIGLGMSGAGALNLLKDAGVISGGMENMVVNGWTSSQPLLNGLPGKVINGAKETNRNNMSDALNVITGLGNLQYDEYMQG